MLRKALIGGEAFRNGRDPVNRRQCPAYASGLGQRSIGNRQNALAGWRIHGRRSPRPAGTGDLGWALGSSQPMGRLRKPQRRQGRSDRESDHGKWWDHQLRRDVLRGLSGQHHRCRRPVRARHRQRASPGVLLTGNGTPGRRNTTSAGSSARRRPRSEPIRSRHLAQLWTHSPWQTDCLSELPAITS
jgi:hypothetical protein